MRSQDFSQKVDEGGRVVISRAKIQPSTFLNVLKSLGQEGKTGRKRIDEYFVRFSGPDQIIGDEVTMDNAGVVSFVKSRFMQDLILTQVIGWDCVYEAPRGRMHEVSLYRLEKPANPDSLLPSFSALISYITPTPGLERLL